MKNTKTENKNNLRKILLAAAAAVFVFACFAIFGATQTKASDSWIIYTNYNDVEGWWYTADGVIDPNYTGFAPNEYGWWRIVNGQVDFNCNSVEYSSEYGWWYSKGGLVQFDYTGIAPNEYGWWRIVNGQVDFNCNSVECNEYGWWYLRGGKVDFDYTGFGHNEYGWWRIVAGMVDFDCNSVEYSSDYGWWYSKGGQVQLDYTGFAPNQYGWWRIVNGQVDFNCSSVEYSSEYGWWYCRGGQIQFDYTGIAPNEYGWWRIVNGQVDFNCNSVECNEYGWWYLKGGQVQFDYTGIAANNYGSWRIENGKVNFDFTGISESDTGNWYCINGEVRFDYNGIINYNGITYNVKNGKAYKGPMIAICSTYGSGYQVDASIINALRNIGCTVIKISSSEDISGYDGLVIAGGIDINPAFYGESDYACEYYSTAYDNEQFAIIKKFVDAQKPILGICRGCELLNVYFGGSLNQNVSGHRGSSKEAIWHADSAKSGSVLGSVCGTSFNVVSQHHQTLKKIASCFNPTMYAADGSVEGIEHYWYPIIGIMWHPEYMNNDAGNAMLNYFAYTMCG